MAREIPPGGGGAPSLPLMSAAGGSLGSADLRRRPTHRSLRGARLASSRVVTHSPELMDCFDLASESEYVQVLVAERACWICSGDPSPAATTASSTSSTGRTRCGRRSGRTWYGVFSSRSPSCASISGTCSPRIPYGRQRSSGSSVRAASKAGWQLTLRRWWTLRGVATASTTGPRPIQEVGRRLRRQDLRRVNARSVKSRGKSIAERLDPDRARRFNSSLDYFFSMVDCRRSGCDHPQPG